MDEKLELKPTVQTYLRLFGVIAADAVSVVSLYAALDPVLATVLGAAIVILTAVAAWKNNSITTGALAADAMKGVLTDAANVKTVTGTWNEVQDVAGQVYTAIKDRGC